MKAARLICTLLATFGLVSPVRAQVAGRGSLTATVTTQNGSIRLPGASVTVTALDGRVVAFDVTDGEGQLRAVVPVGVCAVEASLLGFNTVRTTVRIEAERPAAVGIDLPLTGVSERVDVIG